METSREKAAGTIRLRYSRQFQSGGHTHTVDAESQLPVGASQEMREQVARELEWNVEQLARQIAQRGARPVEAVRPQAPASTTRPPAALEVPQPVTSEAQRPATPSHAQNEPGGAAIHRPASSAAPPSAAPTPVGESMPSAPAAAGERKIRLPDFINAIKRHWDMSPQEAMKLLKVQSLDGLNYRETFNSLKAIVERRNASAGGSSGTTRPGPIVEAPRSSGQGMPPAPGTRPSSDQATNMTIVPRTQGQSAPRAVQQAASATTPALKIVSPTGQERAHNHTPEPGVDFAGSPKAPIPIQFGTVRDVAPRAYQFEEEVDEEYELPEEENTGDQLAGRLKLDELKEIHGNTSASAGRLKVLDNVMGSQISETQMLKILLAAWG
ncbi:MAG: hypothetical protein ACRDHW_04855, partial [Ktedonobacteraceae bacterium]